jgi:hypothetical protein
MALASPQGISESLSGTSSLERDRAQNLPEDRPDATETTLTRVVERPCRITPAKMTRRCRPRRATTLGSSSPLTTPAPSSIGKTADPLPGRFTPSLPLFPSTRGSERRRRDAGTKGEAIVRRLVHLQTHNGSFNLGLRPEDELVDLFGYNVRGVICSFTEAIARRHRLSTEPGLPLNQLGDFEKVAVAIVIVARLEKCFDCCRDMWPLLVENAKDFVSEWLVTKLQTTSTADLVHTARMEIERLNLRIGERTPDRIRQAAYSGQGSAADYRRSQHSSIREQVIDRSIPAPAISDSNTHTQYIPQTPQFPLFVPATYPSR